MKKNETLTLIEGNFTYDEVQEIISKMISSKINYHKMKNWSSQEMYKKDDEIAQKRIPALKIEMQKLLAIVSEAKAQNKRLSVSSEINITLVDA